MPASRPDDAALADAAAALSVSGGLAGFRLNAPARMEAAFLLDGEAVTIAFDPHAAPMEGGGAEVLVAQAGQVWRLARWRVAGSAAGGASDGAILSPMPGRVIALSALQGETVTKGQKLLTLEAMKMEHSLTAPFDGVIAELNVSEGAQVSEGAVLVRIEKREDA